MLNKFSVNFTIYGRASIEAKNTLDAKKKIEKILEQIQHKTNVSFHIEINDVEEEE